MEMDRSHFTHGTKTTPTDLHQVGKENKDSQGKQSHGDEQ